MYRIVHYNLWAPQVGKSMVQPLISIYLHKIRLLHACKAQNSVYVLPTHWLTIFSYETDKIIDRLRIIPSKIIRKSCKCCFSSFIFVFHTQRSCIILYYLYTSRTKHTHTPQIIMGTQMHTYTHHGR